MADKARIERIRQRMADRLKLYAEKNEKYGDAFTKTFQAYGPISALTRMKDKMYRLETLILNPNIGAGDESIIDTLTDLANYCDMTIEAISEMAAEAPQVEAPKPEKKKLRKKRKPKAEKAEEAEKKAPFLEKMTKADLLAIAKPLGLAYNNKTSREVLIAMIEKAFDTEADLIQWMESHQPEETK